MRATQATCHAHLREVVDHVLQQLLLRLLCAEHGRHLLAHVPNQQHVDLAGTHALHKLVDLAVAAVREKTQMARQAGKEAGKESGAEQGRESGRDSGR